ncbi:MAG: hypothetical protein R6X02_28125 [Enhygromyxa sp.]
MTRAASLLVPASLLLASTLALGCSDRGTHSLAIEGSEQVVNGVTTADQWTVSFDQLVVVVHNPGLIERTDNEPAWVREPGVSVWDVTQAPDEDELISRVIRASRYDGADFRIAPTSESGYEPVAGNVGDSVVEAAAKDGWSVHVVGSATDSTTTVSFDWTLATNTFYRCKFDGDEVVELGADGEETTVIEILGEALFGDDFGPIAAADADGDGTVTQAELESAGLWDAIESAHLGGIRGAGSCPVVD